MWSVANVLLLHCFRPMPRPKQRNVFGVISDTQLFVSVLHSKYVQSMSQNQVIRG